jgi:hypothetical protein
MTEPAFPSLLSTVNAAIQAAWTGPGSSPFIAETALPSDVETKARDILRRITPAVLFARAPTLAVWGTLKPLADNYAAETRDVYLHIGNFLQEDLGGQSDRDEFKARYRIAARKIGIPVSGNEPTALFFAPLGPPATFHSNLAEAFVETALLRGPPAIEDTSSARAWQRTAVALYCPGLKRLETTIAFDQSAWCARRFEAWRQGRDPSGEVERQLFQCYDRAIAARNRSRDDITGPPKVLWQNDHLILQMERSRQRQSIRKPGDAFPTQVASGKAIGVRAPWTAQIEWICRSRSTNVPFAPLDTEILVFDAETGLLLDRVSPEITELEASTDHLVILSARGSESPSFGPSMSAVDPSFQIAWATSRESLRFDWRPPLTFLRPSETAIWISGTLVGQSGTRRLYDASGHVEIQIDPEIGGRDRILRARIGADDMRFAPITVAADGSCQVPFSRFRLDAPGRPCPVTFEVLAPGAAGDPEARADLTATSWIWPGYTCPETSVEQLPRAENLDPAHCAGLKLLEDRIEIDLSADIDKPLLGLSHEGKGRSFELRAQLERLWHCRIEESDRVLVPRGSILALGTERRHDTLRLRSTDREADLLVLGERTFRPFSARQEWEIGAAQIETVGEDDRIALVRKTGRVDVLARLQRIDNPSGISVHSEAGRLTLSMKVPFTCDAVEAVHETIAAETVTGQVWLGRLPVDISPFPGLSARLDDSRSRLEVGLDPALMRGPGRVSLSLRREGQRAYEPLVDGNLTRVILGIPGQVPTPAEQLGQDALRRHLGQLSKFLAEPTSPLLYGQIRDALNPQYRATFDALARTRMIRPLLPALDTCREDGGIPRHDLLGPAPWILEADPVAYQAIDRRSGLSHLSKILRNCPLPKRPDPGGDNPLGIWLDRLAGDARLPDVLSASELTRGFEVFRTRLATTDLSVLIDDSPIGRIMGLISGVWSENLDSLRRYDHGGGGSDAVVRRAASLERLARAAAQRQTADHLADLAFRTGISQDEVGRVMTIALRAGIEIFVYFRTLWAPVSSDLHNT